MNVKTTLILILGGGLGALARYYISGIFPVYRDFPLGTLLVNSLASFLLGYLYGLLFSGLDVSSEWRLFLGTGFCGGLSTFSTFSYETFSLIREGELSIAMMNILANVLVTLTLVYLGFILAIRR
ncbi:camphor resistance protein CrcB [Pyrococcus sp. NA2]|uniref:fluoride efflux transporter CrcB n=1 Tax=Pyrococcus sp. (strain NA2) TaxID=342949 RepID=UPI000209ADC3|nr:fluoride efflux transporter CrcB [Pyrococcus sp. NA2]AEC51008.1 camphor resistance protein CrcB [Pyrococcus sp. NA2]